MRFTFMDVTITGANNYADGESFYGTACNLKKQ